MNCRPGESLLSKDDLKRTIDEFVANSNIYKLIEDVYYTEAVTVRDSLEQSFDDYITMFQNKPVDLGLNLQDIANKGKLLEPIIKEISVQLKKYPSLIEQLNKRIEAVKPLEDKYNKLKPICLYNCKNAELKNGEYFNSKNRFQWCCIIYFMSIINNVKYKYARILRNMHFEAENASHY